MQKTNKDLFDFLEKIYELRINNQSGAVSSIEAKALQLLAGVGIFLPLALALLINNTKIEFNICIIAGCIASLLCIGIGCFVLWTKQFKIRPKISTFYNDTINLTPEAMKREALLDMQKANNDNNNSLRWKGWGFNIMVILFCASVFLITLGILVQKVNITYNVNNITNNTNDRRFKQPTKSVTGSITKSR